MLSGGPQGSLDDLQVPHGERLMTVERQYFLPGALSVLLLQHSYILRLMHACLTLHQNPINGRPL